MMQLLTDQKMIIAGPCALESKDQLQQSVRIIQQLGIRIMRASVWKPRTKPGWDGSGDETVPFLLEETLSRGIVPATEVLNRHHAQTIVSAMSSFGNDAKIVVWIGARNQNHLEQIAIAKTLLCSHEGILLMYKNQLWPDEGHWLGIHDHLVHAGFPRNRLLTCHRGFFCDQEAHPCGYRNKPDFPMAMSVKAKIGVPMLLDPSHIGGSADNVYAVCQSCIAYDFDGFMIEMHHEPMAAKIDAKQQLSPDQLFRVLEYLGAHVTKK